MNFAIAATNPVNQFVWWGAYILEQVAAHWATVSHALAIGTLVFVLTMLYQRTQSGDDPSLRVQQSSAAGSASILLSGVSVTALGVLTIAVLLWPAPVKNLGLAAFLILLVVGHYVIEKREVEMN